MASKLNTGIPFRRTIGLCICLPLIWIYVASRFASPVSSEVDVIIATSLGEITVRIDTLRAPVTASNFLRYVDEGLYNGGTFFRTVRLENQPDDSLRIEVIQGGANREKREQFFDAIELERTSSTGLLHLDGTISMARSGPDTATSSFFICIENQPELDFGGMRNPDGQGFAAFGQVTRGMDVVRAIQMAPADGQSIRVPVVIQKTRRID